jgi:hypothetical protein
VGSVTRLGDLEESELVAGTAAERLGMVRDLTLAAWALRGEPIPDCLRVHAPGRLVLPPVSEP